MHRNNMIFTSGVAATVATALFLFVSPLTDIRNAPKAASTTKTTTPPALEAERITARTSKGTKKNKKLSKKERRKKRKERKAAKRAAFIQKWNNMSDAEKAAYRAKNPNKKFIPEIKLAPQSN